MVYIYNAILFLGLAIGLPLWLPYVVMSKKRRKSFLQRLTILPSMQILKTGLFQPQSEKSIWVHTLSVGETLAALPLIKSLKKQLSHIPVFVTTSTYTGYETALNTYHDVADALIYAPFDLPHAVNRMIRTVDPCLVLIIETDVWPNMMMALKRRQVPAIFVNAKISDRSLRRYRALSFLSGPLFSLFNKICAQSKEDRRRFQLLGVAAGRIEVTGNIKYDQTSDTITESEQKHWAQILNLQRTHQIVIAGSTHAGEEVIIRDAFAQLKKENGDLYLIVVPRDPLRAAEVLQLFESTGFRFAPLSVLENRREPRELDGVVVDTLGLLRKLYQIADIAIVGGSLAAIKGIGGHNPLEPAACSKPILFGPYVHNFREIYHHFETAGGARRVQSTATLKEAVSRLLNNRQLADQMGKRAYEVFSQNQGAVDRTIDVIADAL